MAERVHEFNPASEDQTHQLTQNLRDKHAKKCFTEIRECFFLYKYSTNTRPKRLSILSVALWIYVSVRNGMK